jgi:hypothetical protein
MRRFRNGLLYATVDSERRWTVQSALKGRHVEEEVVRCAVATVRSQLPTFTHD